ncbi:iron ABC transporter substrate-binding protein [Pectobacterium wasabiae]|uniref:ABC transporter ATP-binding protein n=1 Tax=Pectobacterium wasabiae TaxID=55208 RepID=A0AAW3EE24_9GAMM|nr:iron ABC transporter substrate-binding protein [Pectobacterium wasabiae]AOR63462.1 ABC transporter ATP-binding protein [Pectobacterium wasabiae CFBP 3304]EJS92764.1 Periplasmic binding family protein [Pectobacterium wasabiae CFBP 3304]KFX03217.1 ABC transporter ATP-binding protein [Pectobacterium wasabiae]KGA26905.1 ABC transporter ATP-binding protein [Pectobacterium wasabiae]
MGMNRRAFLSYLAALSALPLLPASFAYAFDRIAGRFGQIPAPSDIRRVISAGPPADMLLLALAPEKLLGFSSFDLSGESGALFSETVRRLPRLGRLSGRASTLSLEKLLALNPDIIIDCGSADETYRSLAQRTSQQTGVPYVLVDGGLQDTPAQLRQVGQLLNVTTRAEQQAQFAESILQRANAYRVNAQAEKPRFYFARGALGLETGLRGSLHTEAVELLGFENAATAGELNTLTQVSMEHILTWNPEVIITQDVQSYQHITRSEQWQGVDAVARQRVILMSGLPFGWLDAPPGLNRLLGLCRLQSHFDPATAQQLKSDTRAFFHLFYHTDLNDAQLEQLLRVA